MPASSRQALIASRWSELVVASGRFPPPSRHSYDGTFATEVSHGFPFVDFLKACSTITLSVRCQTSRVRRSYMGVFSASRQCGDSLQRNFNRRSLIAVSRTPARIQLAVLQGRLLNGGAWATDCRFFMSAKNGNRRRTKVVIPLENGIQVIGVGMDPGFHRGADDGGVMQGKSD